MNLREYRRHGQKLADHLPWAVLVAPGIVLNKVDFDALPGYGGYQYRRYFSNA